MKKSIICCFIIITLLVTVRAAGTIPACNIFIIRGDYNGDRNIDLSDAVGILSYLFLGENLKSCLEASDVNDDEKVDISDAVYLLRFLFSNGPQPPWPYPEPGVVMGRKIDFEKGDKIKTLIVEFEDKDSVSGILCCKEAYKGCQLLDSNSVNECNDPFIYSTTEIYNNKDGYWDFEFPGGYGGKPIRFYSFYYINEFVKREALQYEKIYSDLFNIEILGPYKLDTNPPKSLDDVPDFVKNELAKRNIDISNYDEVNILFLNQGEYYYRAYSGLPLRYFSYSETRVDNIQTVDAFIHENFHTLPYFFGLHQGTSDLWEQPCPRNKMYWSCNIIPDGIPEPQKNPLYPQEKGCMMSSGISLAEDGEQRAWNNFDEVEICSKSAKELGWTD